VLVIIDKFREKEVGLETRNAYVLLYRFLVKQMKYSIIIDVLFLEELLT
jgi:hypothetical protein